MNLALRGGLNHSFSTYNPHRSNPGDLSHTATFPICDEEGASSCSDVESPCKEDGTLVFPTSSLELVKTLNSLARKYRSGEDAHSLFTPLSEYEEKQIRLLSEKMSNLLQVLEENLEDVDISEDFIKPKSILMSSIIPQNSPLLRRRRLHISKHEVLSQYSNLKS